MTDEQRRQADLFGALAGLLAIEANGLQHAWNQAATIILAALSADLVDVLLYEAQSEELVAIGTPASALGRKQRAAGLNRRSLADRGLTVRVFQTGRPFRTGRSDLEPAERKDIVEKLGISSQILCRIQIGRDIRGVLQAGASQPDQFTETDLHFLELAARCLSLIGQAAVRRGPTTASKGEAGRHSSATEVHRLTRRERQVAALIASGLTNNEIAERLVLVPGTVSNHIAHMLRKLHAGRRAQIATWAVTHGLYQPPHGKIQDARSGRSGRAKTKQRGLRD